MATMVPLLQTRVNQGLFKALPQPGGWFKRTGGPMIQGGKCTFLARHDSGQQDPGPGQNVFNGLHLLAKSCSLSIGNLNPFATCETG